MAEPEDDREAVTVTLPTTPPVTLKLDAPALEALLGKLGEFRYFPRCLRRFRRRSRSLALGIQPGKPVPTFYTGLSFYIFEIPDLAGFATYFRGTTPADWHRRDSPGTFNRRIREHSDDSPFGVDDADLESFDWVLLDLDVHCRQHK